MWVYSAMKNGYKLFNLYSNDTRPSKLTDNKTTSGSWNFSQYDIYYVRLICFIGFSATLNASRVVYLLFYPYFSVVCVFGYSFVLRRYQRKENKLMLKRSNTNETIFRTVDNDMKLLNAHYTLQYIMAYLPKTNLFDRRYVSRNQE